MTDFASAYGSRGMGALRLCGFLGLIAALVPVHLVYRLIRPGDPFHITQIFHRGIMRVLGFRVRVHGAIASPSPVLFVANHASYLDIPVLSALIPAAFVAKAEVAGWPLIGFLAKMQNTVFVERRAIRAVTPKQPVALPACKETESGHFSRRHLDRRDESPAFQKQPFQRH